MSDPKSKSDGSKTGGSKTAKPFSEDAEDGHTPGMDEAPLDRADAVGDDAKKDEMSKVTQREE